MVAVNNWNRRPPVPLSGDSPVAQPIVHRPFANSPFLQKPNHGLTSFRAWQAIKWAGIYHHPFILIGLCQSLRGEAFLLWLNHDSEGEMIFFGEFEVTLVVGGNSHNRSGAVLKEDEIGHPDGDFLFGQRIDGICTGENPLLFRVGGGSDYPIFRPHPLDEGLNARFALSELQGQGMLRC